MLEAALMFTIESLELIQSTLEISQKGPKKMFNLGFHQYFGQEKKKIYQAWICSFTLIIFIEVIKF